MSKKHPRLHKHLHALRSVVHNVTFRFATFSRFRDDVANLCNSVAESRVTPADSEDGPSKETNSRMPFDVGTGAAPIDRAGLAGKSIHRVDARAKSLAKIDEVELQRRKLGKYLKRPCRAPASSCVLYVTGQAHRGHSLKASRTIGPPWLPVRYVMAH